MKIKLRSVKQGNIINELKEELSKIEKEYDPACQITADCIDKISKLLYEELFMFLGKIRGQVLETLPNCDDSWCSKMFKRYGINCKKEVEKILDNLNNP